jgi:predicted permease
MSERRYRWLLRLLPPSFREDHESELMQVWRDELRDAADDGRSAPWLSAARDTLRVAPREHAATAVRNVRVAIRRLRRTPSFAITAILTLALGTGATASVFGLVNTVLLRPLPWRSPQSVGLIWPIQPSGERTWLSFPEIEDLQGELTSVSAVAGFTDYRPTLVSHGNGVELQALAVSHNFFSLLGISPAAGRNFSRADGRRGAHNVVMLSHAFWRAQFASNPAIVGQSVRLDDRPYTVIGILPSNFAVLPPSSVLPERVDIWLPLEPHLASRNRSVRILHAVARVADEEQFTRVNDELRKYAARAQAASAATYPGGNWSFSIVPFQEHVVARARMPLYLLFGLVTLVLVMACANVASLLLIRGEARRHELSLRTALGAGPAKLAGELLAETLVLSTAGCGLGLGLAAAVPPLLRSLDPAALPRLNEAELDLSVLAFMAGLVLVTAALFTSIPMLERVRFATPGVATGVRRGSGARARFGRPLVVLQTALATTVVITALFLTQAFIHLQRIDLGFAPRHVLTGRVTLSSKYPPGPDAARYFERAIAEVARVPGVRSVGAVTQLPLSGAMLSSTFLSRSSVEPQRIDADLRGVTSHYFDVMNTPIRQGRGFTDHDTPTSAPVAIVDESFARRLSPDGRVVGRRIRWFRQPDVELEIVGVVGNVRHRGPAEETRETVYRPYQQYARSSMFLVVRTAGDAAHLSPRVRASLATVDPSQPFADVMTMEARFDRVVSQARTSLMLAAVLAVIALALSLVGLYGVLSFGVARRMREFGIRIALGASPASVKRLVLAEGLTLTTIGASVGLFGAVVVVQLARTMLSNAAADDVRSYVAGIVVILVSSAVAYWLPATRARDTDLSITLRGD